MNSNAVNKMFVLSEMLRNMVLGRNRMPVKVINGDIFSRFVHKDQRTFVIKPKPGDGKAFRRKVHFLEEYTVKPLEVTNLGGRDPITGRKVCSGIGGGIKHKYHWIKWERDGPTEGPPQEEKVIRIIKCGCRTSDVALVAVKDQMKYILATENMKPGDIIRTSKFLPRNPVRPNEGDAYPVGALPVGTLIHNIQILPQHSTTIVHSAGCCAIVKKFINDKVIVQLPSKQEMALNPHCMVTVGKLSNVAHGSTPIGSAQRARELGYRPRSGLRQRRTGRFGRKIKPLPPVVHYHGPKAEPEVIRCTLPNIKL